MSCTSSLSSSSQSFSFCLQESIEKRMRLIQVDRAQRGICLQQHYMSVRLSVCLSICLPVCLLVYMIICLSVCLSLCLPICQFVSLSVCPSVYLFPTAAAWSAPKTRSTSFTSRAERARGSPESGNWRSYRARLAVAA